MMRSVLPNKKRAAIKQAARSIGNIIHNRNFAPIPYGRKMFESGKITSQIDGFL